MSTQCFFDLFDSAAFRGERRRFYGPARLEGQLLGLDKTARVSLRVGGHAAVFIETASGEATTIGGGESVDSLEAGSIKWLEVKPVAPG